MNNAAGENESFNADQITSPVGNSSRCDIIYRMIMHFKFVSFTFSECDKSPKILIDMNKNGEDEDGQRNTLYENDT